MYFPVARPDTTKGSCHDQAAYCVSYHRKDECLVESLYFDKSQSLILSHLPYRFSAAFTKEPVVNQVFGAPKGPSAEA